MIDHKPIMNAITVLIERHLRHDKIHMSEFKKVQETMDNYWTEYAKKNPRAGPYDSYLAAWLMHDQDRLEGYPSYFLDRIEEECKGA